MDANTKSNSLRWLAKLLILAAILCIYIIGVRPLRNTLTDMQFIFLVRPGLLQTSAVQLQERQARALVFQFESDDHTFSWQVNTPFGFYFIIVFSGLILWMDRKKNLLLMLVILHGCCLLINIWILGSLSTNSAELFMLTDILNRVLLPFMSLGILPWVFTSGLMKTKYERKA